jgi:hypothetical protein
MTIRSAVGTAFAVAVTMTCSASAAVVSFTNSVLWNFYSTNAGASVVTETFNGIADGFYASPFSGSAGPINWLATASGGLYVQGGQFSTNNPEAMTFTMSPGVQGVAGNFYGTDINFNVVPAIVQVTLNDGTSYIGFQNAATDFVGFYSTGAAISSITISGQSPTSGGSVYPTANNLYFAVVPAPGALALLAVAGLASKRRNRA